MPRWPVPKEVAKYLPLSIYRRLNPNFNSDLPLSVSKTHLKNHSPRISLTHPVSETHAQRQQLVLQGAFLDGRGRAFPLDNLATLTTPQLREVTRCPLDASAVSDLTEQTISIGTRRGA